MSKTTRERGEGKGERGGGERECERERQKEREGKRERERRERGEREKRHTYINQTSRQRLERKINSNVKLADSRGARRDFTRRSFEGGVYLTFLFVPDDSAHILRRVYTVQSAAPDRSAFMAV